MHADWHECIWTCYIACVYIIVPCELVCHGQQGMTSGGIRKLPLIIRICALRKAFDMHAECVPNSVVWGSGPTIENRVHTHTPHMNSRMYSRGTHLTDGKCIRANRLASNIAIAQYIIGCAGCAPSSHPLFVSIPFYYDWAYRFIGTSAHKMPGQPWIASIYVQIQYIWVQNQSKPARECVNARTAMIII